MTTPKGLLVADSLSTLSPSAIRCYPRSDPTGWLPRLLVLWPPGSGLPVIPVRAPLGVALGYSAGRFFTQAICYPAATRSTARAQSSATSQRDRRPAVNRDYTPCPMPYDDPMSATAAHRRFDRRHPHNLARRRQKVAAAARRMRCDHKMGFGVAMDPVSNEPVGMVCKVCGTQYRVVTWS